MITEGVKVGKPIAIRFSVSPKKGTPCAEVIFEFIEDNCPVRLKWIGWLTEKSAPRTVQTLWEVLKYNGSRVCNATTGTLTDPKVIDFISPVSLTVEARTGEDGKERMEIAWVNAPGGGAQFAAVKPEVIDAALRKIGFDALYLSAKRASGYALGKTASQQDDPMGMKRDYNDYDENPDAPGPFHEVDKEGIPF